MAPDVITNLCSILQYLLDRGEVDGIVSTVERVRWQNPQPQIDHLHVYTEDGRLVRITAEVVETHEHVFEDEDEPCTVCGVYPGPGT
jgi:coenzyme F420-reducing hydrogenase beta subunit